MALIRFGHARVSTVSQISVSQFEGAENNSPATPSVDVIYESVDVEAMVATRHGAMLNDPATFEGKLTLETGPSQLKHPAVPYLWMEGQKGEYADTSEPIILHEFSAHDEDSDWGSAVPMFNELASAAMDTPDITEPFPEIMKFVLFDEEYVTTETVDILMTPDLIAIFEQLVEPASEGLTELAESALQSPTGIKPEFVEEYGPSPGIYFQPNILTLSGTHTKSAQHLITFKFEGSGWEAQPAVIQTDTAAYDAANDAIQVIYNAQLGYLNDMFEHVASPAAGATFPNKDLITSEALYDYLAYPSLIVAWKPLFEALEAHKNSLISHGAPPSLEEIHAASGSEQDFEIWRDLVYPAGHSTLEGLKWIGNEAYNNFSTENVIKTLTFWDVVKEGGVTNYLTKNWMLVGGALALFLVLR